MYDLNIVSRIYFTKMDQLIWFMWYKLYHMSHITWALLPVGCSQQARLFWVSTKVIVFLPFGFRLLEGIKLLGAGEATGGVWTGVTRAFGATLADGLLILFSYFIILWNPSMSIKMKRKNLKFEKWVGFGVFKLFSVNRRETIFPFSFLLVIVWIIFGKFKARKWKSDNLHLTFLDAFENSA